MTSQKDDLVDRRKVEAWQHVEPKRTNRGIAFLCSTYCFYACITTISRVDLTSNWCSSTTSINISSILHRDKILKQNHWICGSPLVSFLGVHSAREIPVPIPNTEVKPGSGDYTALRETSKMPNYTKKPPQRVAFRLSRRSLGKRKATRGGGGNFVS